MYFLPGSFDIILYSLILSPSFQDLISVGWLNKSFKGFACGVAGISQLSPVLGFAEGQSDTHHTLNKEPGGEGEPSEWELGRAGCPP